jgi:hypothetical protein
MDIDYIAGRLNEICKQQGDCESCPLAKIEDEDAICCAYGCLADYIKQEAE